MMTRTEIETDYRLNDAGIITSPGKFEGQMVYAPYLHDLLQYDDGVELESNSDASSGTDALELTPEDLKQFPELEGFKVAVITEHNDGFVTVDLTNKSIDELQAEFGVEEESED
jgi:hypothetical protein